MLRKSEINQNVIIISLIQHFEADFPKKVRFKILNSGLFLKSFTHVYLVHDMKPVNGLCKQVTAYGNYVINLSDVRKTAVCISQLILCARVCSLLMT